MENKNRKLEEKCNISKPHSRLIKRLWPDCHQKLIELPIDQESKEEINDNNCLKDGLEIKDHLISDIDKEKNRMKKKLIVHFESHSS